MEVSIVTPFLKWAGGKRQILNELRKYYPEDIKNYFEPFLGGGSVFFDLQSLGKVKGYSYISDLNGELVNAYQVIQESPIKLIEKLISFREQDSKDFFLKMRSLDRLPDFLLNTSNIDRAARFIYLNKTCFNGIWRVNMNNQFNVPYANNRNPSIFQETNILSCHKVLKKNTNVSHEDFEKVLKKAKKGDFIFIDPPYDPLSKSANFTGYTDSRFHKEEQIKLANIFKKLDKKGCSLMLTNSNTDFIRQLYCEYETYFKFIDVKRYINSKSHLRDEIKEIIITNY